MKLKALQVWLESGEYLPKFMRDFHDQKDVFKSIYYLYQDSPGKDRMPSWLSSHIFVIDWFLWFMASRGYTLQKSRKRIEFREFVDFRDLTEHDPLYKQTKALDDCPFCGCEMRIESNRDWHKLKGEHGEDCYFDEDHEAAYLATEDGLLELKAHWNKRA